MPTLRHPEVLPNYVAGEGPLTTDSSKREVIKRARVGGLGYFHHLLVCHRVSTPLVGVMIKCRPSPTRSYPLRLRMSTPQTQDAGFCQPLISASWNKGACLFSGQCIYRHVCATCQQAHQARHCTRTPEHSPFKVRQGSRNQPAASPPSMSLYEHRLCLPLTHLSHVLAINTRISAGSVILYIWFKPS